MIERPSDALHAAAKSLIRIAQQVNLRAHPGPDVTEEVLAEIREHVPGAIIDQAQYFVALVRVLADAMLRLVTYASNGART